MQWTSCGKWQTIKNGKRARNKTCRFASDRIDIRAVRPMTQKEHQVGGCTALLDAVGRAIPPEALEAIRRDKKKHGGKR